MVKQRPRTSRGVKKQNKHSRTVWKHVERAVHRESIDRRDGRGVDSNTEPVTASARSAEHELGDHGSGGPEHKASTNLWGSDYGQPKHRQIVYIGTGSTASTAAVKRAREDATSTAQLARWLSEHEMRPSTGASARERVEAIRARVASRGTSLG